MSESPIEPNWANKLSAYHKNVNQFQAVTSGKLKRVVGLTMEAVGCRAPIGSQCSVETLNGEISAEVVGFSDDILYLMPSEEVLGVLPGATVRPLSQQKEYRWGWNYWVEWLMALVGRLMV